MLFIAAVIMFALRFQHRSSATKYILSITECNLVIFPSAVLSIKMQRSLIKTKEYATFIVYLLTPPAHLSVFYRKHDLSN